MNFEQHEHEHSLYIRCGDCLMFGIPGPEEHKDNGLCGNCNSRNTYAYYPTCCLKNLKQKYHRIFNANGDNYEGIV